MVEFRFSRRSRGNLSGVAAPLVAVVEQALSVSTVDFSVVEGLRTAERQRQLFNDGASRTLNSRHLTGHAVDLVPWTGRSTWAWGPVVAVARAVRDSARAHDLPVRWGAVWDRVLSELGDDLAVEVLEYQTRVPQPFLDGTHFEI